MNDASITRILILAEPDTGRHWEAILRGPETSVWLGRDTIPPGEHPEVILADASAPLVQARGAIGVIRVGGDQPSAGAGPADICLPANCTGEELRRTCQLLSEIVRLRSQQRDAVKDQRALLQAAMTDPLTGLPNRRAWNVELSRRLARPGDGRQLCLAIIDLDQLKKINDSCGHPAGDRLLQTTGRAMQENLRQDDLVARIGGDEFGLLIWTSGEPDAAAVVERVRRRVAESADEIGFAAVTVSAGFAVSEVPLAADAAQTLFLAADMALLAAKYAGGNRCLPNPADTKWKRDAPACG
jgi:diguanylate cyclase (GGDEF)-like protein